MNTVEEYINGKEVVLFGGSPDFDNPDLQNPVVVSVNNHFMWQEGKGRYGYTNGVYHGSGYGGMIAGFMNQPPKELKFVCQNAASPYGQALKGWASNMGYTYYPYATNEVERHEIGVDPGAYEEEFKPLIEVCSHPFTGVLAAYHLLSMNPKKLYLTGFTFYSNAKESIKGGKRGEHDIEQNKKGMELVLNDDRCEPDEFLQKSL